MRIVVLGAGAWGTALANVAARGANDVVLWARNADHVAEMQAEKTNRRRLPGVAFAANLRASSNQDDLAGASAILAVVPAQAMRGVLTDLASHIPAGIPIVVCAKGIEQKTELFMSDVVRAVLPKNPPVILSGPSFADDVGKKLPTAVTLAAEDGALAERLAVALAAPWFRLYHSRDVRGVEIGGAAKNVLAIASGIASGRGLGASAGAALIARGFAELSRFGRAFGAQPSTLMGLSGLGDLVLTCGSAQSRNFSLGLGLGRGLSLEEASGGKLAEGAFTADVLVRMARAHAIDMPISHAVNDVLGGRIGVAEVIEQLLARPPKAEA